MKKVKFLSYGLAIVSASIIGLTGCGGGGGGSTISGPVFPSESVLAEPTLPNAQKVTELVVGNPIDNIPILNSVNNNTNVNTELLSRNVAKKITKYTKNINIDTYSLNEVIDEQILCATSGTIDLSGSADASGGTVTFTFNECNDGDDLILNGIAQASVSDYDTTADDFKTWAITFITDLTMTDLSETLIAKIVKGSYLKINVLTFDIYGYPQTYKLSISIQATDGIEVVGLENVVFYYDETTYPDMEVYQTAGRIYINNLAAYVEYDTTYDMSATPFVYLNGVLTTGEARYIMAHGAKMKIVIANGTVTTWVDADGDGIYETNDQTPTGTLTLTAVD